MNFDYFQMLQTVSVERVDEKKMGSFVYLSSFVPALWTLNCLKKCILYNFMLNSARNLSL